MDFGELDKAMLRFLRELLTVLLTKQRDDKLQEIFMHVATLKKFKQLRNALRYLPFLLLLNGLLNCYIDL